jgi:hypothetical protein
VNTIKKAPGPAIHRFRVTSFNTGSAVLCALCAREDKDSYKDINEGSYDKNKDNYQAVGKKSINVVSYIFILSVERLDGSFPELLALDSINYKLWVGHQETNVC